MTVMESDSVICLNNPTMDVPSSGLLLIHDP